MLSERDHRPALLGRIAASGESVDLFFADALSRFKSPSDRDGYAPERPLDPMPHKSSHHSYAARPSSARVHDMDSLLHNQLLRGVHKVWNEGARHGGVEEEASARRPVRRQGAAQSGVGRVSKPAASRDRFASRSVGWGEAAGADGHGVPPRADEAVDEAFGSHSTTALRRRRAVEQAAASQRRRVELRAVKESILRELHAEQQRSGALQAEVEARLASLDLEHQVQLDVLQSALGDVETQVLIVAEDAQRVVDDAVAHAEAQLGLQGELSRLEVLSIERSLAEAQTAYERLQRESAQRLEVAEKCLEATSAELEAQRQAAAAAHAVAMDLRREMAEAQAMPSPPRPDQPRPLDGLDQQIGAQLAEARQRVSCLLGTPLDEQADSAAPPDSMAACTSGSSGGAPSSDGDALEAQGAISPTPTSATLAPQSACLRAAAWSVGPPSACRPPSVRVLHMSPARREGMELSQRLLEAQGQLLLRLHGSARLGRLMGGWVAWTAAMRRMSAEMAEARESTIEEREVRRERNQRLELSRNQVSSQSQQEQLQRKIDELERDLERARELAATSSERAENLELQLSRERMRTLTAEQHHKNLREGLLGREATAGSEVALRAQMHEMEQEYATALASARQEAELLRQRLHTTLQVGEQRATQLQERVMATEERLHGEHRAQMSKLQAKSRAEVEALHHEIEELQAASHDRELAMQAAKQSWKLREHELRAEVKMAMAALEEERAAREAAEAEAKEYSEGIAAEAEAEAAEAAEAALAERELEWERERQQALAERQAMQAELELERRRVREAADRRSADLADFEARLEQVEESAEEMLLEAKADADEALREAADNAARLDELATELSTAHAELEKQRADLVRSRAELAQAHEAASSIQAKLEGELLEARQELAAVVEAAVAEQASAMAQLAVECALRDTEAGELVKSLTSRLQAEIDAKNELLSSGVGSPAIALRKLKLASTLDLTGRWAEEYDSLESDSSMDEKIALEAEREYESLESQLDADALLEVRLEAQLAVNSVTLSTELRSFDNLLSAMLSSVDLEKEGPTARGESTPLRRRTVSQGSAGYCGLRAISFSNSERGRASSHEIVPQDHSLTPPSSPGPFIRSSPPEGVRRSPDFLRNRSSSIAKYWTPRQEAVINEGRVNGSKPLTAQELVLRERRQQYLRISQLEESLRKANSNHDEMRLKLQAADARLREAEAYHPRADGNTKRRSASGLVDPISSPSFVREAASGQTDGKGALEKLQKSYDELASKVLVLSGQLKTADRREMELRSDMEVSKEVLLQEVRQEEEAQRDREFVESYDLIQQEVGKESQLQALKIQLEEKVLQLEQLRAQLKTQDLEQEQEHNSTLDRVQQSHDDLANKVVVQSELLRAAGQRLENDALEATGQRHANEALERVQRSHDDLAKKVVVQSEQLKSAGRREMDLRSDMEVSKEVLLEEVRQEELQREHQLFDPEEAHKRIATEEASQLQSMKLQLEEKVHLLEELQVKVQMQDLQQDVANQIGLQARLDEALLEVEASGFQAHTLRHQLAQADAKTKEQDHRVAQAQATIDSLRSDLTRALESAAEAEASAILAAAMEHAAQSSQADVERARKALELRVREQDEMLEECEAEIRMLKINSQTNAQKQAAEEIGETNNVESAELLEVKDALDRASTRLEASRAEALELRRRLEEIEEAAETRRRDDEATIASLRSDLKHAHETASEAEAAAIDASAAAKEAVLQAKAAAEEVDTIQDTLERVVREKSDIEARALELQALLDELRARNAVSGEATAFHGPAATREIVDGMTHTSRESNNQVRVDHQVEQQQQDLNGGASNVDVAVIGQSVDEGLASLRREQNVEYQEHFSRLQQASSDAAALQNELRSTIAGLRATGSADLTSGTTNPAKNEFSLSSEPKLTGLSRKKAVALDSTAVPSELTSDGERDAVPARIRDLQAALDAAALTKAASESEVQHLRQQLSHSNKKAEERRQHDEATIAQLRTDLKRTRKMAADSEAAAAQAIESLNEAVAAAATSRSEVEAAESQTAAAWAELEAIKTSRKRDASTVMSADSPAKVSVSAIAREDISKISGRNADHDTLVAELQALESLMSAMTEQIEKTEAQYQEEVERARNQMALEKHDQQDYSEREAYLKQEAERLKRQAAMLEDTIQQQQDAYHSVVSSLETDVEAERSTASTIGTILGDELRRDEYFVANRTEVESELRREADARQRVVQMLEQELEDLSAKLKLAQAEASLLRQGLDDSSGSMTPSGLAAIVTPPAKGKRGFPGWLGGSGQPSRPSESEGTSTPRKDQQQTLEDQQTKLEDATALVQRRGEQLSEARSSLQRATQELSQVNAERDRLRSELSAKKTELQTKQQQVEQLTQQLEQVIRSSQKAVGSSKR